MAMVAHSASSIQCPVGPLAGPPLKAGPVPLAEDVAEVSLAYVFRGLNRRAGWTIIALYALFVAALLATV
jgi:hypothetical protein